MHLLGCLVGSEAESWEGRRGLLLLSGFWEGSNWAVTLYRADQDTSGFCVPKLLLPCVTPFFLFLLLISLLLRLPIFFLFGHTGSLVGS